MPTKTISERLEEMKKIYTELARLGLGDQFDEIKQFQQICNDYVRNGSSISGSINISYIGRKLFYNFPISSHHKCVAYLKAL
jgi:hypothetical protein